MLKKLTIAALLLSICTLTTFAQANICGGSGMNNVFNNGEEVKYKVFYTMAGIWTETGEASFVTSNSSYNGRAAYHIVARGKTYSGFDWFFKVRDTYETYIDQEKMVPLRFKRDVNEGKTKFKNDVTFNHDKRKATSDSKQFNIEKCTQDVLSTIYFARNIDYDQYSIGSKIPFSLFLDNELHNINIKYMGKAKIRTKYGTFNAIKIMPQLIKGNIFKGDDGMIIYVSDDKNHIPLRIESAILVGSIKVDLMSFKGLKYALSSKIK